MLRTLTSVVFLVVSMTCAAVAQTPTQVSSFSTALGKMRAGDWSEALRAAAAAGPVARDVIEWHRLRAARGDFDAVQSFLERNGDWPGLKLLRRRAESKLPLGTRADEVIAFFADEPPQTGNGAVALAAAYRAKGLDSDAEATAVMGWLGHTLSSEDQAWLLAHFGDTLREHHEARLDMLLWRDADEAAKRMLHLVGDDWRRLARARMALRANREGVDGLIAAVPSSLADDPGLAFERMQWRARRGNNAGAIEMMLSRDPDDLGEPSRWASWRRALARAEMRAGRTDRAYKLAAGHGLEDGTAKSDLEWLAGYIALRFRDDPEAALGHFRALRENVASPISLGRAGYWEGRALEAMGDEDGAREAYEFAARYQTSFYGLLAADAIDAPMDPALAGIIDYPDIADTSMAGSSVLEAGRLMIAAGERSLAVVFLAHLAEGRSEEEIGALGEMVLELGEPYVAVMIGKRVAREGTVVPEVYYPLYDFGLAAMPVPEELPLSIARRESEFNAAAQSGAGARGLMQVMPGTASDLARWLEVDYDLSRLTSDPGYNARLGTTYLDELMAWFDGNPVMVAAAYNAGPGRPLNWMKSLGDPRRGDGPDIVDWIEMIPFDETRNYVMRVTESLPVYRARLTGTVEDEVRFLDELTARPGHIRQAVKGRLVRPLPRPPALTD